MQMTWNFAQSRDLSFGTTFLKAVLQLPVFVAYKFDCSKFPVPLLPEEMPTEKKIDDYKNCNICNICIQT